MAEIDEYIKRYCVKHEISREEAEKHALVKEAAKYYENDNKGKIKGVENESNRRIEV